MVELNSQALFDRAKRVMPGGVNSPVRACTAVGRIPRFISRADGDRIGNEYIDYVCSWGPGILGHAHPKVLEAVKKACDEGLTYGAPTAREVEMAELIRELVPSMEVSRMVSSGTEAVMSAVRVARGFTGRDDILKFEGCYHGHSDGLLVKAGSGLLTGSVPTSAGVPEDYAQHTIVVPYNDIEAVSQVFAERGQTLAAVVVEPVAANMGVVLPKPGFLEFLREITLKYGTLLIFDEVITGFRLGLSGAQTPGSVPKTSGSVPKISGSVPNVLDGVLGQIGIEKVYLDPMIGFGTSREEDIELLGSVPELAKLGKVLVGASRKRIVKKLTGEKMTGKNLGGNLGIAVWSAMKGASVVRVHDVKETFQALKVVETLG